MSKHNFENAENAVYQLLATLSTHNLLEFPGLRELGLKPTDIRGDALAMACQCTKARLKDTINDRWEGRLEAMSYYDIVDLVELKKFIEDWASNEST